jgi:PAS domain S-box-containing protein
MNRQKWFRFTGLMAIALILTCVSGIVFYSFIVAYGVQNEEKSLLTRAITTAALIDASKVQALGGNQEDQKSSVYVYLRAQLKSLQSINTDLRFVYIMKLSNNEVIFLVDAEPQSSEDYSAPGDVYDEASPKLLNIFKDKQPFIEGPITDEWGRWISAHAPIIDPVTEKIIAIIGLDIDASRWEKSIFLYKVFGASIPFFFTIVVIVFSTALFRISIVNARLNRVISQRKQAEESLESSKERLETFLHLIPAGIIIVDAETHEIVDANPKAAAIIGKPVEQFVGAQCHKFMCPADKGACPITDLGQTIDNSERVLINANGDRVPVLKTVIPMEIDDRKLLIECFKDISERKRSEVERENLIKELETALSEVKTLSGLLPICASCKKIRDDKGYWNQMESYIHKHSEAQFSHGLCPDCFKVEMEKLDAME